MIIYKVTNIVNNKIYIGQTTLSLDARRKKHIRDAKSGNTNMAFHRALRKYGLDNFCWEVLEVCDTIDQLDEMELHYIIQYNSLNSGYNTSINTKCQAGELNPNYGNTMSEESRKRISNFNRRLYKDKKNHPWFGKKHTKAARVKMKIARNKRPPISEATRLKMSKAQSGRKHSEESKAKMRAARALREAKRLEVT